MKNKKLTDKEIGSFCTQLSMLLKAGITPFDSISLIIEDTTQKSDLEILNNIKASLLEGNTLSESLIKTSLFPEYMTNMLMFGEDTGSLDITLENLGNYYEKMDSIYESIKTALFFPVIMIFIMFFMIFILLTSILPSINKVYEQFGSVLSGFSAFLFKISRTLQSISTIGYLLFFIAVVLIIIFYKRSSFTKRKFLPRSITESSYYSELASCLALVTSSGIDFYHGLSLVRNVIEDDIIGHKIDLTMKYLNENGDYIYEALRKAEIFQAFQLRLLEIGYKTGDPDTAFKKIAQSYEDEFTNKIQRSLSAIEPTLVIIFSIIVGMILISSLLPLIGIMANIG